MLPVLADTVAALAVLLVLLVLSLVAVRAVALRRLRQQAEFRPAAEAALAQYLAGTAPRRSWPAGANGLSSWPSPRKRWPTFAGRNGTGWSPCCSGWASPGTPCVA
jgi:hypothetical protein